MTRPMGSRPSFLNEAPPNPTLKASKCECALRIDMCNDSTMMAAFRFAGRKVGKMGMRWGFHDSTANPQLRPQL